MSDLDEDSMVLLSDRGPARTITLNRPHQLSATTVDSYRAVADPFKEISTSESFRCVLVEGAGRAFCSGADVRELQTADRVTLTAAFTEMIVALVACPKPIVAVVQGPAVGFGATLLTCDVVIVVRSARLRFPFVELGTVAEADGSWLPPLIVRLRIAIELMVTGRWIASHEAVALRLATLECAESDLSSHAAELANRKSAADAPAMAATKRLLRHGWPSDIAAALEREQSEACALGAGPLTPCAHRA